MSNVTLINIENSPYFRHLHGICREYMHGSLNKLEWNKNESIQS